MPGERTTRWQRRVRRDNGRQATFKPVDLPQIQEFSPLETLAVES